MVNVQAGATLLLLSAKMYVTVVTPTEKVSPGAAVRLSRIGCPMSVAVGSAKLT